MCALKIGCKKFRFCNVFMIYCLLKKRLTRLKISCQTYNSNSYISWSEAVFWLTLAVNNTSQVHAEQSGEHQVHVEMEMKIEQQSIKFM